MASKQKGNAFKIPLMLIVLVLTLDVSTKFLTHQFLPKMNGANYWYPYGGIGVFQDLGGIEFSISHAVNLGAAWGIGANYQLWILLLRIVLITGLCIYFWRFQKSFVERIFISLIIAGALGNVIDYFFYGHVVDMLHFVLFGYDFPVFNLADSAIFVGVTGHLMSSWKFAKA